MMFEFSFLSGTAVITKRKLNLFRRQMFWLGVFQSSPSERFRFRL